MTKGGEKVNRVIIVDKDASIRMLYGEELTEEGYEVITSGDGSQLMGLISKYRPDIVVMAIRLGNYNGLDLLQDIRDRYHLLPVILCTAFSEYRYDQRSMAADYFVVKSSNMDELKTRIKMAIEGEIHFQAAWRNTEDRWIKPQPAEQTIFNW
jgi:DNA-binding response OmpR family regulator